MRTAAKAPRPAKSEAGDINAAPVETYFLASLMMNIVNWLLGIVGLEHNPTIVTWTYT